MGARRIFYVHSLVSQLLCFFFTIVTKTWSLQSSRRLVLLHVHVSAGSCQQRLTTWDNYWIFCRRTKTPFRPMHLDFQKEDHVCTETWDRINLVITIVFKIVTKLPWESQPLICLTLPRTLTSPPTHPSTLLLPRLVSFSLHLFKKVFFMPVEFTG